MHCNMSVFLRTYPEISYIEAGFNYKIYFFYYFLFSFKVLQIIWKKNISCGLDRWSLVCVLDVTNNTKLKHFRDHIDFIFSSYLNWRNWFKTYTGKSVIILKNWKKTEKTEHKYPSPKNDSLMLAYRYKVHW